MKQLLRGLLGRLSLQLKHTSKDPLVRLIDEARELTRLSRADTLLCQHTLENLALFAKLGHLLQLHQPDLVIDVGANRGQFVSHLRAIGYSGPVLSLEPQATLAAALQKRAASDPHWKIIQGAASDASGQMTLHTFADDTFNSLHRPNSTAHTRFGNLLTASTPEQVAVRTLDSWLADSAFASARRIFLKTDTQGHEMAVLRGASQTLGHTVIVLAEGSLVPLYDTVATPAALTDFLATRGFRNAGNYSTAHDERDLATIEVDCVFSRAHPQPPQPSPRTTA